MTDKTPSDVNDNSGQPSHLQTPNVNGLTPTELDALRQKIGKYLSQAYYNGLDRKGWSLAEEKRAVDGIIEAMQAHYRKLFDEVIGADEKSEHIRQFQCPNYGNGCYGHEEQYKSSQEAPYCTVDGKKMKSVEFDQQTGDDWARNELRAEQRARFNELMGDV